jgi:hypothetical protein
LLRVAGEATYGDKFARVAAIVEDHDGTYEGAKVQVGYVGDAPALFPTRTSAVSVSASAISAFSAGLSDPLDRATWERGGQI